MSDPPPHADPAKPQRPRRIRRLLRFLAKSLLVIALLIMAGWATLAVYYADTRPPFHRPIRACAFVIACVAMLLFVKPRRRAIGLFVALFAVVVAWFISLKPSNSRAWVVENALLPYAIINGDKVAIHNIRNFDYKSESDFTPAWETRVYDLSKVRSADYIISYWTSTTFAHAMMSFGFEDGRYLCISIETRREKGEEFSSIQGLFKQFELIYIIGDERDLVRLRTNFRDENVYLYRTRMTPGRARVTLLDYLQYANNLAAQPQFYNAMTSNCTTGIFQHASTQPPYPKWTLEILFNGYTPRYGYEQKVVDTSLSFDELQKRSRVNDIARAAGRDALFSQRIRENLIIPPRWGEPQTPTPPPAAVPVPDTRPSAPGTTAPH